MNLIPVLVSKQCKLNVDVSKSSIPELFRTGATERVLEIACNECHTDAKRSVSLTSNPVEKSTRVVSVGFGVVVVQVVVVVVARSSLA